jgi:hypothetical protein
MIKNISHGYFYQPICQGGPTWPINLTTFKLQKKKNQKDIMRIESEIPTMKLFKDDAFLEYANHMLTNLETLLTFYGFQTAKDRFNLYQGRQRAPDTIVNMLLDRATKYNRQKRKKKKDDGNKKNKRRNCKPRE